jgi:hypothetical protein
VAIFLLNGNAESIQLRSQSKLTLNLAARKANLTIKLNGSMVISVAPYLIGILSNRV